MGYFRQNTWALRRRAIFKLPILYWVEGVVDEEL